MLSRENLKQLLDAAPGPCVSIYQPTHRMHPGNRQDPIRFRNLVKKAAESLQQQHPQGEHESMLAPLHALAADHDFWNHTADGLAVFAAPERFETALLQRTVPELSIVAPSFHVKPLIRIVQSADRFHVLAVNRREVRLYEGNRDALDEINLNDAVPRTVTDALGDELAEPEAQVLSYGTGPSAPGAGSNRGHGGQKTGGMQHAHGSKKDVIDQQTEKFFRAVDRAIAEHYSKPSGLPLILAALPEHHAPFREVSHNAQLVDARIEINPDALALDDLRARAWHAMEPVYLHRLAELSERFGAARAAHTGDDRLNDVGRAAVQGRVDVLLLEASRQVPGRLDSATGAPRIGVLDDPQIDDMLDDLAERVLATGGDVVVAPADRMPTTTGLAAIYRY